MFPGAKKDKTAPPTRRNLSPAASKQIEVETDGTESQEAGEVGFDIVSACQRGDRAAQHELYQRCHQSIYGLMVRMVGLQDAADLTQQVFLQVYRTIGQFSGRSRFRTWLYRLAVNESLQYLRRRRRWRSGRLQHEPVDESLGQSRRAEQKELLEQALGRLDPPLCGIVLLREVEGLSYGEIAQVLGIAEGTVGSRLNRARRQLKKHLTDLGWEP